MLTAVRAQQPEAERVDWKPLEIKRSYFPRNIGMMDAEREEYADNLAGLAVMQLRVHKFSKQSLDQARRMVALALHLSPRNKRAVVVNAQLGRDMRPEQPEIDYQPKSFARLILKRAELLKKQEGNGNLELGGYLLSLAAELNPKSEDAIYLNALHHLDHGEMDWSRLTDPEANSTP